MPRVGTDEQAWALALSTVQAALDGTRKTLDALQGVTEQIRQQMQVGFNTLQTGVTSLSLQVGQINGRVRHVEDRSEDHSQGLADLSGQVAAHMAKLAELDAIVAEREKTQLAMRAEMKEGDQELKGGQARLWERLWEVTKTVFRVTEGLAVVAAVLKFAGVW